ncbi:MAG: ABC transporter permease [Acidimicrobiia bacterium]|nr:ABC transporter permease [Acidimicrobiia bacterium]
MRLRFLLSEAVANLRRNALVVIGAILAVAVSIALTFGAVLVAEVVRINTVRWEEGVRVIGWVNDQLSPQGVNALVAEVSGWEGVDSVTYVSKTEAYDEALRMFREGSVTRETIEEDPNLLPASIRINPNDSQEYRVIEDRLRATPGIEEVSSPSGALEVMFTLKNFVTQGSLILALVLALSAVVLIANTIRLAIYARREEVSIMKLVGASNWFVRVPFLLEGMVEGLLGGALAVGALAGGYQTFVAGREDALPDLFRLDVGGDFLWQWGLTLMALGVFVGVVGSGVALRRFLREA